MPINRKLNFLLKVNLNSKLRGKVIFELMKESVTENFLDATFNVYFNRKFSVRYIPYIHQWYIDNY